MYKNYSESQLSLEFRSNLELKQAVAANMKKFGGKFDSSLADCLMTADRANMFRLVSAFRAEIVKFLPENWGGSNGKQK